jgi:gluconate:H+ symporter, GntP family
VGVTMGRVFRDRLRVTPGPLADQLSAAAPGRRPGFGISLATVLLPVVLIMLATFAGLVWSEGTWPRRWIEFVGTPVVAMLLAVLAAAYVFGTALGHPREQLQRFAEESLGPVASVLLVVGAGGGFGSVLAAAGVDRAIASAASGWELSPLLLGWALAAALRIAVGSATVTITTSASIMAPIAAATPGTSPELLVIAMGAGSLIASHVNDGGFWLVKEYLNLSVPQTLATWTVLETVIAVVVLMFVLVADAVT